MYINNLLCKCGNHKYHIYCSGSLVDVGKVELTNTGEITTLLLSARTAVWSMPVVLTE